MQKLLLLLLSSLFYFQISAQDDNLLFVKSIPIELRIKANAVVRLNKVHIDIVSYNKFIYTNKRIVTVLNKEGDYKVNTYQHYGQNVKIQGMEARVYNSDGKEIKKFRKRSEEHTSELQSRENL